MDTKKMILVGALGAVAVVSFLQLQRMNAGSGSVPETPQEVAAPTVEYVNEVDYAEVLVATQDIPLGTRLNSSVISWKKWPSEALSPNFINRENNPQIMEEMVAAVARTTIYAGEPIVQRKVAFAGDRSQMAAILKPGMRAVSTRISVDSAAGGFILPGDRVDIVLTTLVMNAPKVGVSMGQKNYVATTIMENVHVLAIGQTFGDVAEGGASIIGSTALLELSQADAELMTEAQSKGDVSLILRGLDNRRPGFVQSAATKPRDKTTAVSSMVIYRNGQPQSVAIQGQ